jgi:hypothetical protein
MSFRAASIVDFLSSDTRHHPVFLKRRDAHKGVPDKNRSAGVDPVKPAAQDTFGIS